MKLKDTKQAASWLKSNENLLNFKEISRRCAVDIGTLHRAVNGKNDALDRKIKIPERCLAELNNIYNELKG